MSEGSRQPRARQGRSLSAVGWFLVALAVVALGMAIATPIGGWVQSFFFGSGVRWDNAFRVFEMHEFTPPGNAAERERLRVEMARLEDEPPARVDRLPRIHAWGTLATLRYEALDERGEVSDEWTVRALVPSLGNGQGPIWQEGCPAACRDALADSNGTRLERSGEAGIGTEWILRMPLGQRFDLGARTLQTQDILENVPRRVGATSQAIDGRTVPTPANVRVALIEACAGDVRVGIVTQLDFYPFAILPIPRGFRDTRWVQLNGCGVLVPLPPRKSAPSKTNAIDTSSVLASSEATTSASPPIDAAEPLEPGTVVVRREPGSGFASLRVDESWLMRHGKPVIFQGSAFCRFDSASGAWQRLPATWPERGTIRIPVATPDEARKGERTVMELPREIALFWLQWTERQEEDKPARTVGLREAFVTSGPMQCEDLTLGPPPAGQVAACIPFANRAEARFVPQPAGACAR